MKALDVPVTNMTELKKSSAKIISEAAQTKNGVYIFNCNTPQAVTMTANDYNKLIKKINKLEDKLLDLEVEEEAKRRIHRKHKSYTEKEVFGKEGLNDVDIDENDDWE